MKKVHLVVLEKDRTVALEILRGLGVVHVEPLKEPVGSALDDARHEARVVAEAAAILSSRKKAQASCGDLPDGKALAREIDHCMHEIHALKEEVVRLEALITRWAAWGDFSPSDLTVLHSRGLEAGLCELTDADLKEVPEGVTVEVLSREGARSRSLVIAAGGVQIPWACLDIPDQGPEEMRRVREEKLCRIGELEKKIDAQVPYLPALQKVLAVLEGEVAFHEVAGGMSAEGPLLVLRGFVPAPESSRVREAAQKQGWAILLEDPAEADAVPTLLKNPAWIEFLRPVLNILSILPGYREVDISPVFFIFFVIFVGMLIGDAGYGAVVALIFGGVHIASASRIKDHAFFILVYLLCGAAILWGVLTGVYFGQAWVTGTLKPLVPWLNDTKNIQELCFLIGAVHLSIAHLWRIALKWPSLDCLVDVGWLLIVWVMFFAARFYILGYPLASPLIYVLVAGVALLLFFPKFKVDPLLPLQVINMFTDVVSYIRLFAVGLATVAVADAANSMGNIPAAVILHALNISLCGLAIMVHGVRLNVLEFSSHMGLEWSGRTYQPFKDVEKVS
ncbi:MAG: hypothetical protein GX606_00035 [Elusimicrobia bacterium]|nr:hypothetical protein [Elusimicrobiota bacterium]